MTENVGAVRTSGQQGATKCHPIHAVSSFSVHEDAVTVMHLSCHVTCAFNSFIFRIIYLLPEAWKHETATEETIVLLCV